MKRVTVYLALGKPLCGVEKLTFHNLNDARQFIKGVEYGKGYVDLAASLHKVDVLQYIEKTPSNLDKNDMIKEIEEV